MNDMYILDGKQAVKCVDLLRWGEWNEKYPTSRRVAAEFYKETFVSTVFLGLDHSFGVGPPLLFETTVFGGPLDGEQTRCTTWDEAEASHIAMVKRVKERGANPILRLGRWALGIVRRKN